MVVLRVNRTNSNSSNNSRQTGSLDITVSGEGCDTDGGCYGDQCAGNSCFNFSYAEWHGYFNASDRYHRHRATDDYSCRRHLVTYTLTATAGVAGYSPDTVTITVGSPASLGTISITAIGPQSNGVQLFTVTVRDTNNAFITTPLAVTVSGPGLGSQIVNTTSGSGNANVTLPTTAGLVHADGEC